MGIHKLYLEAAVEMRTALFNFIKNKRKEDVDLSDVEMITMFLEPFCTKEEMFHKFHEDSVEEIYNMYHSFIDETIQLQVLYLS